jgi:hypothetical protein
VPWIQTLRSHKLWRDIPTVCIPCVAHCWSCC